MLSKTKSAAPRCAARKGRREGVGALRRPRDAPAAIDDSSRPAPTPSLDPRRPSRRRASATCARSCRPPTRITMSRCYRAASPAASSRFAGGAEGRARATAARSSWPSCSSGLRPAAVAAPERRAPLVETWQRTPSNPGYRTSPRSPSNSRPSSTRTARRRVSDGCAAVRRGPQLQRRGAASGMDDSASLSAASLQRHREAAEAAQIRQAIADQHHARRGADVDVQEEAMLARAVEESRQSASAQRRTPCAGAPPADPFAAPPSPTLPPRPPRTACGTAGAAARPGADPLLRRRHPARRAAGSLAPPAPPAATAADPAAAPPAPPAQPTRPTRSGAARQRPQAQRIRSRHPRRRPSAVPGRRKTGGGRVRRPALPPSTAASAFAPAPPQPAAAAAPPPADPFAGMAAATPAASSAGTSPMPPRRRRQTPDDWRRRPRDDAATVGDDAARHRLRGAGPAAARRLGGDDGAASRRDDARRRRLPAPGAPQAADPADPLPGWRAWRRRRSRA